MKKLFISCGHGGFKEKYHCLAEGKQFKHDGLQLHHGNHFYEGESNRIIGELLINKLAKEDIEIVPVYDRYYDWHLGYRVDLANWRYTQDNLKSSFDNKHLFIDIHSNAFDTTVRGLECFTLNSKLKELGEKYLNNLSKSLEVLNRRVKEANFHVLKQTLMPSILFENLFFDNREDVQMLINPEVQDKIAEYMYRFIVEYFEN